MTMDNNNLTIAQAATQFGVSTKTIRRWISAGLIAAERVGPRLIRVDADSVKRLAKPIAPTAAYQEF